MYENKGTADLKVAHTRRSGVSKSIDMRQVNSLFTGNSGTQGVTAFSSTQRNTVVDNVRSLPLHLIS
jgi:hypothetical protein